jgi:predicted HicB family RNase H-like nuclease
LGNIRIVIPDELHQALRERAVKERKTLKQLVIELLRRGIEHAGPS